MLREPFRLLVLALLCASARLEAQLWAPLLPSNRAIDWSSAGVPGGVPNRTVICVTLNPASYGNGADAGRVIQAALNNCPQNGVVLLQPGSYRIASSIRIPSSVTLRGAGPAVTTLSLWGNGPAAITFGTESSPTPARSSRILGSPVKGDTAIAVSDAGAIRAGALLLLSQQDDPDLMTPNGSSGPCSWCDGGWPGNMDAGQIVEVTGVHGNQITFAPGLFMNYFDALSPMAYVFPAGAKFAGLESLTLSANGTGYSTNILLNGTAYCWVKNVESDFADGDHVRIYWGLRNEIRDSYFHDGFSHRPGATDDTVVLAHKSSANLVENNIFWRQHISVMLEWGAAGNVIAYNYSTGTYHDPSLTWMITDFNFHGAHPMFNLLEGNVGTKFQSDSTWGSSSHTTLFRNWFTAANAYVPPSDSRGRLDPQNAVPETRNVFAYSIDFLSLYPNLIANLAGAQAVSSKRNMRAAAVSPTAGGSAPACYRWGYNSDNDAPGVPPFGGPTAYGTALLYGNYDCAGGAPAGISNPAFVTIPASFYRTTKPSWFGSVPWPAIGPDVSGGFGPGRNAEKIPAQLCYETARRDSSGFIIFEPGVCYGR